MCRLREFAWRSRSTRKAHVLGDSAGRSQRQRPSSDGRGLSTALAPSGAGARSPWKSRRRRARRGRVPRPAAPHACPSSSMRSFGLSRLRPGATNGPVGDLRSPPLSMSASSSDTALANARLHSSGRSCSWSPAKARGPPTTVELDEKHRQFHGLLCQVLGEDADAGSPRWSGRALDHRAMRLRKWCTTSSGTSCTKSPPPLVRREDRVEPRQEVGLGHTPLHYWPLVSARSRRARMARSSRMCAIDTL